MAFRSERGVRNQLVIAALAGLLTVIGKFGSATYLEEPWRSAVDAALDAVILIAIGIGIAAVLDRRAAERGRLYRALARAEQLTRLGPSLKLAANGWVHRPGHSAPEDEDFSVGAGLKELETQGKVLEKIELGLREQHERRFREQDTEWTAQELVYLRLYCWQVSNLAYQYWFEGGRPSRFAHLIGLRRFLESEVMDAEDDVRARFTAFASALDLAEAARHKTDAVIQERLIVSVVRPERSRWPMLVRYGDETDAVIRSVTHIAQDTDSVLYLSIAAAALTEQCVKLLRESKDSQQGASAGFTNDVLGVLNRCVGALEHEVANVRIVLLRLSEFVVALEQEAGHRAGPVAS